MLVATIVIKDDSLRKKVENILHAYCLKAGVQIKTISFSSINALSAAGLSCVDFGVQDVENIDERAPDYEEKARKSYGYLPPIAILCNSDGDAMKCVKVKVTNCLLKSRVDTDLFNAIEQCISDADHIKGCSLFIKVKSSVYRLKLDDIVYIEVYGHNIVYHMINGSEFTVRGRISEIDEILKDKGFFRCHDCFIVNWRHTCVSGPDCLLVNGKKIPVSRRKKTVLNKIIKETFKDSKNILLFNYK